MPNVAEIITKHVTLDVKCVDRLYLNGYVPRLQSEGGVVAFLRRVGGRGIPSPALFGGITEAFRTRLRAWAEARRVPWIEFKKEDGKKDDFVEKYRTRFPWPATPPMRSRSVSTATSGPSGSSSGAGSRLPPWTMGS